MEWIIEDVVAIVNGDWEMMAAIFVLELDAVRGVVGIGDFTVYVSDGDGSWQTDTYLLGKRKGGCACGYKNEYLSFWLRTKSQLLHRQ